MADSVLAVWVNGETRRASTGCTVAGLIRDLGLSGARIAVAVNRDVVPRSAFDRHRLQSGDRIKILEAVEGLAMSDTYTAVGRS